MNDDDVPFWKLVLHYWKYVVTSSLLAVGLSIWSVFGGPIPAWVAWILVITGIILAIYLAGLYTHGERRKHAEKLKLKLRICGIGPPSHDHRRIMVHNLTCRTVRFKVKLLETRPKLDDYALPVGLQPTHGQLLDEAEVEANGNQPVDVFVDRGPPNDIGLKLMGNPPCTYPIARDLRRELLIRVYPVSEDGEGDTRWFAIVPQRDGSVIFTPDG